MEHRVVQEEQDAMSSRPHYEHIKTHIYIQYEQALNFLFYVNTDLAQKRYPRDAASFISSVIRLYVTLAPKIDYSPRKGKDKQSAYAVLKNMDAYVESPGSLTIKDAKTYFMYMRWLLEDIGITKIETPMKASDAKAMELYTG